MNTALTISVQKVSEVKTEKKEEEISFRNYQKLNSEILEKETNRKGSLKRISFE